VVLARHKLRHYFKAHPVTVVSSFPLGESFATQTRLAGSPSGLWSLWVKTLSYAPRKAIKYQIPADFVAEWTDT
jgi:hypothetical protein